jgi:hypothetical protein
VIFLILLFSGSVLAQEVPVAVPEPSPVVTPTPAEQTPAAVVPVDPTDEDEDYEVDYEEEGDLPPPKKARSKNIKPEDREASNSGSRAKNRFSSPAKSETKSVYKKNGVALEVDTD